mgnify:CR=1 FL=1
MRTIFSSSILKRAACLASLHAYFRGETGSPPRPFLRTGVVFHDAADRYNKHLLRVRRATDLEEAPRFVDEAIAAAPDLSGEQDMDIRGVYRRHVANWSIDPDKALGAERAILLDRDLNVIPWDPALEYDGDRGAFLAALDRTPTPFLRAKLDYVEVRDGRLRIVDYKTSWGVFAPATVAALLQPRLYAWLGLRALLPDAEAIDVELRFSRWGATRTVTYTPDDLEAWADDLMAVIRRIEETPPEAVRPTVCSFCDLCEYRRGCVAWEREEDPAITGEDPAALLASVHTAREFAKAGTAWLKKLVDLDGPASVGDLTYGPKAEASKVYDTRAAFDYLSVHVDDPLACFKVDGNAIKRLPPDVRQELEMVAATDEVSTRFDIRSGK